jgi:phosphoglycolate phosphatase
VAGGDGADVCGDAAAVAGETEAEAQRLCFEDIMRLNGKQTIYQMIQLAERSRNAGKRPRTRFGTRTSICAGWTNGSGAGSRACARVDRTADEWLVHGARGLLEHLRARGLALYLASGTDEQYVKQEARMLDLEQYFGPHIYGALDDYKKFSKKMVIDRILRENRIPGNSCCPSATATSRSRTRRK